MSFQAFITLEHTPSKPQEVLFDRLSMTSDTSFSMVS